MQRRQAIRSCRAISVGRKMDCGASSRIAARSAGDDDSRCPAGDAACAKNVRPSHLLDQDVAAAWGPNVVPSYDPLRVRFHALRPGHPPILDPGKAAVWLADPQLLAAMKVLLAQERAVG